MKLDKGGTCLNIEKVIIAHQGMIFSLLKKYNIRYDIDEYQQQLSIKMWQLIKQFDTRIHNSMSKFLFQRLNFYLIDLFRQKSIVMDRYITTADYSNYDTKASYEFHPLTKLVSNDYYHLLNENERIWLNLKLFGYKQYEIQRLMKKSATTILRYQKHVRKKLEPLKRFLKGDKTSC